MPMFCRKPQVVSFYSSLMQPYTKLCHRQTERIWTDRHTDEIIYVRFRWYVCISFANFLLCKKYIAQLNYAMTKRKMHKKSYYIHIHTVISQGASNN